MKTLILQIALLSIVSGCSNSNSATQAPATQNVDTPKDIVSLVPAAATVKDLSFLSGCWKGDVNGLTIEENLSGVEGDAIFGISKTLQSSSLIGYELIQIYPVGNKIAYVPIIDGATSAVFYLKELDVSKSLVKFDNPAHDFPKSIQYKRIKTELEIELEGDEGGVHIKEGYTLKWTACAGTP